jgi:3-hydroxyacyl-CoA dehydrogenase
LIKYGIPIYEWRKIWRFPETFLWTHFFNPARYLKLFEIIPGPATSQEVLDSYYMERNFGKQLLLLKTLLLSLEIVLEFWYSKFIPFG